MKLLVTTNARLYKYKGKYYSTLVYDYDFFLRYLTVFEKIRLVAHVEEMGDNYTNNLLRVDGPNLEVFEVPFPHGKVEYIKKYYSIKRKLKKATIGCDAAILRVPDQLTFQLFNIVKRNNIPIAVEVVADSWELFSPSSSKSLFRPFIRLLWHYNQKKCCAKAEGVTYVTKFGLQKRYPPKNESNSSRFTTYYTDAGIDENVITFPRNYVDKDYFNLLHVSTTISSYVKGHKELIISFIQLRNQGHLLKLHLVGGGDLEPDIKQSINESGFDKDVIYHGLVNKDELYDLYKKSDIFVFPSYREGLPRVVLEAMAHGLPCITTDLPGTRELLDEEMLIPIKDTQSLTEKIANLIITPEKINLQSKRNIHVAKQYTDEIIVQKRNEFYSQLYDLASQK